MCGVFLATFAKAAEFEDEEPGGNPLGGGSEEAWAEADEWMKGGPPSCPQTAAVLLLALVRWRRLGILCNRCTTVGFCCCCRLLPPTTLPLGIGTRRALALMGTPEDRRWGTGLALLAATVTDEVAGVEDVEGWGFDTADVDDDGWGNRWILSRELSGSLKLMENK